MGDKLEYDPGFTGVVHSTEWLQVMGHRCMPLLHYCAANAEGRQADVFELDGAASVCNLIAPHVDGGPALHVRPGCTAPSGVGALRCAGALRATDVDADERLQLFVARRLVPGAPGPDTSTSP